MPRTLASWIKSLLMVVQRSSDVLLMSCEEDGL
jgi:hypothetical protein